MAAATAISPHPLSIPNTASHLLYCATRQAACLLLLHPLTCHFQVAAPVATRKRCPPTCIGWAQVVCIPHLPRPLHPTRTSLVAEAPVPASTRIRRLQVLTIAMLQAHPPQVQASTYHCLLHHLLSWGSMADIHPTLVCLHWTASTFWTTTIWSLVTRPSYFPMIKPSICIEKTQREPMTLPFNVTLLSTCMNRQRTTRSLQKSKPTFKKPPRSSRRFLYVAMPNPSITLPTFMLQVPRINLASLILEMHFLCLCKLPNINTRMPPIGKCLIWPCFCFIYCDFRHDDDDPLIPSISFYFSMTWWRTLFRVFFKCQSICSFYTFVYSIYTHTLMPRDTNYPV